MQTRNLYGYAIKGMDDYFSFQKVFVLKKKGISLINRHLLILMGMDPMSPLRQLDRLKSLG
jgi:hypothetical protein